MKEETSFTRGVRAFGIGLIGIIFGLVLIILSGSFDVEPILQNAVLIIGLSIGVGLPISVVLLLALKKI